MQRWEERARDEVGASIHQDSLMLQNSLPKYLEQLVDELIAHYASFDLEFGLIGI